jgi:RNA polymerase sigma-70 factor (ECF subfamily)
MAKQNSRWPSADALGALVLRAQGGDASALELLLEGLRPALMRFFASRLREDADQAEDLTQNALGRIARAIERIDPARADVYVSTVARNLLRTAYGRSAVWRRREGEIGCDALEARDEPIDRRVEYEELVRTIHRVIDECMPASLGEIVRALMRDETAAEIAERQGVSPITVRTRLLRARMILRRELKGTLDRDERRGA